MKPRTKFLLNTLLALGVSLLVLVGFTWLQLDIAARDAKTRSIAQAGAVATAIFAAEEARLLAVSRELAANDSLQYAANIDDSNDMQRVLGEYSRSGTKPQLAILSGSGQILAASEGLPPAFGAAAAALEFPAAGSERHVVVPTLVAGDYMLVGIAPLNRGAETKWVASAISVRTGLLPRIANVSGFRASIAGGSSVGATGQLLSLTTAAGKSISLQLSPDTNVRDGLWVAARSAALGGVLFLFLAPLFAASLRGLLAKIVDRPAAHLVREMQRIKEGVYSKPIRAVGSPRMQALATTLNEMQLELSEREARIARYAQYDSLTGLTNRSVVDERLQAAVAKAERSGGSVAALALDISRFKEINGTLGQEFGDEVLKEVARRLATNTRVSDTVARVGGDEFLVILEDADERLTLHLAEFLAASLESPIEFNEETVQVHLHVGVALFPRHSTSAQGLRRMANIALFAAKEQEARVALYEPGQDEKQLRELAIIHDLPSAIKNHELYLQYQPKIDMETQRVEQVEALVRWRHPQLGFIPPEEFVSLIEKAGKTKILTNWVFKTAVEQVRKWLGAGYQLGVAINISAHDLLDDELPETVASVLRHYLVEPALISIEVTESAVMRDPERATAVLKRFKDVGMRIALDDFGTGQTSLAMLKDMPLSELKIDKSFVQNLRADSGDAIIVKSTIDLGHNMGLLVVAEGVESNYCWNLLNSYNCDLVQGYLVSAPLTAEELSEWYLRLQTRHVNKLDLSFVAEHTA